MAIPLFRILFTVSLLLCAVFSFGQNESTSSGSPAAFTKNKGQIVDQTGKPNQEVLFLLNTPGLNVQLRKTGFSYDVYEVSNSASKSRTSIEQRPAHLERISAGSSDSSTVSFHRVDLEFLETGDDLVIQECEASAAYKNYYNVPGREEGITGVTSFSRILYKNLYRGIDLEFFIPSEKTKPVEYNFVVQPGTDISAIKMKISGAEVSLKDNALNMELIHGNLKEIIPKSWIETNEKEKEVAVTYTKLKDNTFGFKLATGENINSGILIIDPTPVREWGTYFGGSYSDGSDHGSMDYDLTGETVYATQTTSDNIATSGSHQDYHFVYSTPLHHSTGLVMKFDTAGDLIWSTYYGGIGSTEFLDIKTDTENNIIAVGYTFADTHIATPNSHQEFQFSQENDGFLVKFNSNGERLWASYYGGLGQDVIQAVATDNSNNIFIGGATGSESNISSPGSFLSNFVNMRGLYPNEGFIAKFDADGNRQWGTYYGGKGEDVITGLAVGNDANLYIVGYTDSEEGIATPGTFKPVLSLNNGSSTRTDAFIAAFNTNGNRIWGTYFGGTGVDWGYDIAVDPNRNVIISGATQSNGDISHNNAHQPDKGGDESDWDDFLAKFNKNGSLLWSTYYGGAERENYVRCAVDTDEENNIYLAGGTSSNSNIATPGSHQENYVGYANAYLVKFDPDGERQWGTYYGHHQAVATDVKAFEEVVYIFGATSSDTGIASQGAYQTEVRLSDAFIAKFAECENSMEVNATEYICSGEDIVFTASGGISYSWSGPNGFVSNEQNPVIENSTINDSGTYTVHVQSPEGCEITSTFEILVSPKPTANQITNIEVCEGNTTSINTSTIESQVLGSQTNMIVKYLDETGNELANPLPNPVTARETVTVRVFHIDNPECYAETSFEIIVNPLPEIINTPSFSTCDDDNDGIGVFDFSNFESDLIGAQTGIQVELFHEDGEQISIPPSGLISNKIPNEETLTARITNQTTNCYNETTIKLQITELPVAYPPTALIGCDDNGDGISEYFDLSGVAAEVLQGQTDLEVNYYRSDGSELSSFTSPYTNLEPYEEILTVRLTTPGTDCYTETSLLLKTSAAPQIISPGIVYSCDEGNGTGSFDTSMWTQQIIGNQTGLKVTYYDGSGNTLPTPLPAVYRNTMTFAETIKVKVENEQKALCVSETEFQLVVNPELKLKLDDSYSICGSEPFLELKMAETFDTWEWRSEDGEILSTTSNVVLHEEGIYSLRVGTFDNGILCEKIRTFSLVRSVSPSIREVDLRDWSSQNFIKIIAEGDGDFEYSIDGINYFETNYFENLSGGTYTAYVRDKNGCGMATQEVILVDYPNFFSPNDDGHNDRWQLQGFSQQPETFIFIFDRYGKLLKQLSSHSSGWDGTFNGNPMPADDYWFRVSLKDGREFKGHFSLIL